MMRSEVQEVHVIQEQVQNRTSEASAQIVADAFHGQLRWIDFFLFLFFFSRETFLRIRIRKWKGIMGLWCNVCLKYIPWFSSKVHTKSIYLLTFGFATYLLAILVKKPIYLYTANNVTHDWVELYKVFETGIHFNFILQVIETELS